MATRHKSKPASPRGGLAAAARKLQKDARQEALQSIRTAVAYGLRPTEEDARVALPELDALTATGPRPRGAPPAEALPGMRVAVALDYHRRRARGEKEAAAALAVAAEWDCGASTVRAAAGEYRAIAQRVAAQGADGGLLASLPPAAALEAVRLLQAIVNDDGEPEPPLSEEEWGAGLSPEIRKLLGSSNAAPRFPRATGVALSRLRELCPDLYLELLQATIRPKSSN